VHADAYEKLRAAAEAEHKTLTHYMDDVAEREFRRSFWESFNASVEALKTDPDAWAADQAESRQLEGTLLDGLQVGEDWRGVFETTDGETAPW
jgi:hypothetical protein